jgi:hypothetical protein
MRGKKVKHLKKLDPSKPNPGRKFGGQNKPIKEKKNAR